MSVVEPSSSHSRAAAHKLTELDITSIARALRFVRVADYCSVFGCGPASIGIVAAILIQVISGNADLIELLILVAMGVILLACAYVGFRNFGTIDDRLLAAYMFVLPPALLCFGLILYGLALEGTSTDPTGLILSVGVCIGAVFGFAGAVQLRRARVEPFKLKFVELLRHLRSQQAALKYDGPTPPVINRPLGIFLGAIGGVLAVIGMVIPRFGGFFSLIGFAILVRSRRYFQVDADELLKHDSREPVLLLRSFEDEQDERTVMRHKFFLLPGKYFLDYSVETRLARYFQKFGPFIAIASPLDSVPQLGAARAKLSEEQWQDVVMRWMQNSKLIVMFAAQTHWVTWELSKVVGGGHPPKLLMLFRKGASLMPFDDSATRLDAVRSSFSGTKWELALASVQQSDTLCTAAFHPDGGITVLRCTLHTYDAYHLGILIAHYSALVQAGETQ